MATAENKVKKLQPWKDEGLKKDEWVAREVAKAVNAGKAWDLETVDFADPNRPPTCLEVDFPIIPINEIAAIEGNAGKPIYQMSKWWARRRSSVFRAMLLAAAIKAPDDPAEAAKLAWQVYYGNHQKKGAFKHLKVADIFMGGGTTVVEGSRLGMQMYGNDLNPVAWFIVKNELAQVDKAEIEGLLADIEAEVKPQIMPFYACDCPRGHKGKWTEASTGEVRGEDFDPLQLTPEERNNYSYSGPEAIYTFWVKHGPCQVTGCGHRTPILSSPLVAIKTLTVKAWLNHKCVNCSKPFDVERDLVRMAFSALFVLAPNEKSYGTMDRSGHYSCPHCRHMAQDEAAAINGKSTVLGKAVNKSIVLSLLIHPDWLRGVSHKGPNGECYGGSVSDNWVSTAMWNSARETSLKLIEVRGDLPDEIRCPDTGEVFHPDERSGTVPKKSHFACAECGTVQDVLKSVKNSGKSGAMFPFMFQGFCPECKSDGVPYGGRFFMHCNIRSFDAAHREWEQRKDADLSEYWPRTELPEGFKTTYQRIPEHGYSRFADMFNPRQLLVHAQLLRSIVRMNARSWGAKEYVLGSFQQFLRNQCMFSFWHIKADKLAPSMSNNNYHPKPSVIEVGVFCPVGYGPWSSTIEPLSESLDWAASPWELVTTATLTLDSAAVAQSISGKSIKARTGDPLGTADLLTCASATELSSMESDSIDLVITDPPFGNNIQYSELADFFYVWLRLALKDRYACFEPDITPKAIEAVSNPVRHPEGPDQFYEHLMTECWKQAHRVMKPGGILAFTFHHSEDSPWVALLESLFQAGFYLEGAYPIRSDETKGGGGKPGTFGSQLIEYDIIHVCRKQHEVPKPISWPKLRRQILQDVRELQELLEHHQDEGLPEADLHVIRRGKALEYFSRHFGKVYKDQDAPMSVLEALLGINQILDEEAGGIKDPPPPNAEPFTRMLLRLFDGKAQLPRDQIQKFLRGTGSGPSDFIDRGWVVEKKKIFYLVPPLEIAQQWVGKQRRGMTSDYDQAMYLIGACYEGSGINASDTLNNPNFRPHPALGAILAWFKTHGADSAVRNAATLASQLYRTWAGKNQTKADQLSLFDTLGEDDD